MVCVTVLYCLSSHLVLEQRKRAADYYYKHRKEILAKRKASYKVLYDQKKAAKAKAEAEAASSASTECKKVTPKER